MLPYNVILCFFFLHLVSKDAVIQGEDSEKCDIKEQKTFHSK